MENGGEAVNEHDKHADPVLITEAALSFDDEMAQRKRKYVIMMSMRVPCLVLAGVFYHTWWLAMALVLLSVPLPWVAVLIANDRPPRKSERVSRFQRSARAIENSSHRVIDSSEKRPER
ncbi:DUF3099 domain-containing protein [Saccharomonospora azurea]|uniref:DUF3099 domain-containing protein n=1 Tax=Saccharomonospora azurea NA-128 TaxID=882081 RepID=H8G3M7_9PSEU|nr:DUF3099 domain-containing protein [Saccharomonospora azurea]EHK82701.1 hypothetical protein SZMC14600_20154 [Saccharomonospora azurea SZMC 14600]EHY88085.1 Protein of unknown function (DUF3099) [Saccharomonospora azurea NA-128]